MNEKQSQRIEDEIAEAQLSDIVAEQVLDLLHEREALGQSLRQMLEAAAARYGNSFLFQKVEGQG